MSVFLAFVELWGGEGGQPFVLTVFISNGNLPTPKGNKAAAPIT